MSGHSKWATIKHKKGAADAARGKLFAKLIRQVEVAAREGGGDPDMNPTLRTMFQKARDASVPLDTIERAIKRGTGELEGVTYEQITYEGYAPGGVAVLVEVLTDNRNRTGAEVRSIFTKLGGSMAEPGAVAWQFERKGIGARRPGRRRGRPDARWRSTPAPRTSPTTARPGGSPRRPPSSTPCAPRSRRRGMTVESSDLTMLPHDHHRRSTTGEAAKKVLRLIDALEDHDDVQDVYANFDIPDDILEGIDA